MHCSIRPEILAINLAIFIEKAPTKKCFFQSKRPIQQSHITWTFYMCQVCLFYAQWKTLSVVYFDQQKGALHGSCRSEYSFSASSGVFPSFSIKITYSKYTGGWNFLFLVSINSPTRFARKGIIAKKLICHPKNYGPAIVLPWAVIWPQLYFPIPYLWDRIKAL